MQRVRGKKRAPGDRLWRKKKEEEEEEEERRRRRREEEEEEEEGLFKADAVNEEDPEAVATARPRVQTTCCRRLRTGLKVRRAPLSLDRCHCTVK